MLDGEVVVRPCYPWSPTIHRLLLHLEEVGFGGAPRFLDSDGTTERLTYLPGAAGPAGWAPAVPEAGLRSMAGLLRRLHEATASYAAAPDDGWSSGQRGGAGGRVILHGDPGPWNVVWDDRGEAVALIDWDHANPGDPLDDLAYLAAHACPLVADDDEAVRWMRHPGPPDRRRRLRVLCEAYDAPATALVDRAIDVLARTNRTVERMARLGLEPQRTWAKETKLARLWDRHAWLVANRSRWI